jgi:hypothetical protein
MFSAMPQLAKQVQLMGSVTADNPAGVTVTFDGQMTGSVTTDAYGHFSYTGVATALGNVTAVATDQNGQTSSIATAQITSMPPSLTAMVTYGSQRQVTVSGTVMDESPGGLTVTFNGVVTGTTSVWGGGHYSFTTNASGLGQVTATVTDWWGLNSQPAQAQVTSMKPWITNFQGTRGLGNWWTFTGQVSDESATGLTVQFGGLASLQTQSATVNDQGTFEETVQLKPGEQGTATAQTTDWWGLQSDTVGYLVS